MNEAHQNDMEAGDRLVGSLTLCGVARMMKDSRSRAGHLLSIYNPDQTVRSFWHCRCTDVTYKLVDYQLSDPTSSWDEEVRDHENAYGDCADNDFSLPEVGLYDHECLKDFHTFLVIHYQIAADTRIWMRGAHFAKGTECSVFDGSQVISNYNCSWPNAYVCQGEDSQKQPFNSFDEAPAAPDVEITPADTAVYVAFVNDTACHENCVTVTTMNQTGTLSKEVCSSHSVVPVSQLKKQATYTITAFTLAIRQSSSLLSNRTSPVTVTTLSAGKNSEHRDITQCHNQSGLYACTASLFIVSELW
ncbi:uncharacterized protein LOC135825028 [Sycon ciliatum]|uniref:uncharacterized protein LOC135825028 n=1 Tax=Sycon ciliatum TaxID=27933 RepID=UPI0031F64F03